MKESEKVFRNSKSSIDNFVKNKNLLMKLREIQNPMELLLIRALNKSIALSHYFSVLFLLKLYCSMIDKNDENLTFQSMWLSVVSPGTSVSKKFEENYTDSEFRISVFGPKDGSRLKR